MKDEMIDSTIIDNIDTLEIISACSKCMMNQCHLHCRYLDGYRELSKEDKQRILDEFYNNMG